MSYVLKLYLKTELEVQGQSIGYFIFLSTLIFMVQANEETLEWVTFKHLRIRKKRKETGSTQESFKSLEFVQG